MDLTQHRNILQFCITVDVQVPGPDYKWSNIMSSPHLMCSLNTGFATVDGIDMVPGLALFELIATLKL